MSLTDDSMVGFDPDEVHLDQPTRAARLKWVLVVDEALPPGRAVNAAVCVAAATVRCSPGTTTPTTIGCCVTYPEEQCAC